MAGLREALEETYEEIDSGSMEAAPEATEVVIEAPAGQDSGSNEQGVGDAGDGGERPRDESGRFLAQEKPAQDKPASSPAGLVAGQGAATGAVTPVAAPVAAPAYKPPQSWKAGVREKWAALPPEVQAEVLRREKEAATALQARAEAAKGAEGWSNAIRPYEAQIRAAGATPEAYVGDLLKTAHALNYSAEPQKADLMAGLIMQFGITPQALDQALVARMNGQGARPATAQPQEFRDPRLDQFFAQQASQASAIADETAGGFAESHEFFNDVADTMADILDTWKTRGKADVTEADMERAYRLACQDNDDVANILEQRKQHAAVATTKVATQRARNAASSVRTQPTAAGSAAQPAGLRAALEAGYDELDR